MSRRPGLRAIAAVLAVAALSGFTIEPKPRLEDASGRAKVVDTSGALLPGAMVEITGQSQIGGAQTVTTPPAGGATVSPPSVGSGSVTTPRANPPAVNTPAVPSRSAGAGGATVTAAAPSVCSTMSSAAIATQ